MGRPPAAPVRSSPAWGLPSARPPGLTPAYGKERRGRVRRGRFTGRASVRVEDTAPKSGGATRQLLRFQQVTRTEKSERGAGDCYRVREPSFRQTAYTDILLSDRGNPAVAVHEAVLMPSDCDAKVSFTVSDGAMVVRPCVFKKRLMMHSNTRSQVG